jgi:hypothetical protein
VNVVIYCKKKSVEIIKAKLSEVLAEGQAENSSHHYILCKMGKLELGELIVNLAEVFDLVSLRNDEDGVWELVAA